MVCELRRRLPRVVILSNDAQTLELVEERDRVCDWFAVPGVGQHHRMSPVRNECVEFSFTLVRHEAVVSGLVYTNRYGVSKLDRKR